jgi:hypothetical protein
MVVWTSQAEGGRDRRGFIRYSKNVQAWIAYNEDEIKEEGSICPSDTCLGWLILAVFWAFLGRKRTAWWRESERDEVADGVAK